MKNKLLLTLFLLHLLGYAQKIDSIPSSIECGLGISKDFYAANNFVNQSYQPKIGYSLDMAVNTGNNLFVGVYVFKNSNKPISNKYFGNVTGANLIDWGFQGKKKYQIMHRLSLVPKVNIGFISLRHKILNTYNDTRIFSSVGYSIGVETGISYKIYPFLNLEVFSSYKHIMFPKLQASDVWNVNYKSTGMISLGTRLSFNR